MTRRARTGPLPTTSPSRGPLSLAGEVRAWEIAQGYIEGGSEN